MPGWSDPLADPETPDPLVLAWMTHEGDPLDALAAYLTPPPWHADAACRGMGPAMFYPEGRGSSPRPGQEVCSGCPVVAECSEAGQAERFGVWGGHTEGERRVVRSRSAPPAA